ncbi:hypothetical protein [Lentzea sp. NPDC051838]|uniref:hypothetical protein n=1 Tax=Lentzea sp. NPDC051838 TaxID=3154849 RepID=UPI003425F7D0
MKSHDALWLASRAAPAALVFINDVQSSLGDIDAAIAEGDWPTAVESSSAALRSVFLCHLVLNGLQGRCAEGELDLLVCLDDGDVAQRLRALPVSYTAGEEDAQAAQRSAREAADELEAGLPVKLPTIRTVKGYFPSVRIGADLEALRKSIGLPPIDWMAWL